MTKELHCRDVGPDCEAVVVADSEEEIVAQAAQHARDVHGMTEDQANEPAFQAHVRAQIRDREEPT